MKKTLRMLLLVLVLCLGLVMPAAAETTDGFASDHICMADMAGVLNEREVTELETMIDEIRTRQKFDIAILTVSEEDIPSVQVQRVLYVHKRIWYYSFHGCRYSICRSADAAGAGGR